MCQERILLVSRITSACSCEPRRRKTQIPREIPVPRVAAGQRVPGVGRSRAPRSRSRFSCSSGSAIRAQSVLITEASRYGLTASPLSAPAAPLGLLGTTLPAPAAGVLLGTAPHQVIWGLQSLFFQSSESFLALAMAVSVK